ncbi:MAG: AMP-binding protein, partial [Muribaculaceae bacterium]|nr:AMP-binding protein [Muribaculaceae bacterium]
MPNILTNLIQERLRDKADTTAMWHRTSTADSEARWEPVTWRRFGADVEAVACAMEILGIREQERVAVFSENRPEVIITDFAAWANRAVPVSIYSTSSASQ